MLKKLAKPFKAEKEDSQGEQNEDGDPLSPVVYSIGRLEECSLCTSCRSNDFTALFRNPEVYIPDQAGYQCTPRTVAHILQNRQSCHFCMLTYFCLTSLGLDDIPKSDAFTVTSHAWTAGSSVNGTDEDSDAERSLESKENTVAWKDASDQCYVRIVFRVCEIADEKDLYYFTHRDMGGGRTLIEMRQRPCYKQDSRFGLQHWFESTEHNSQTSLSGRPLANQIRFDLVRYWVSCLTTTKNSDATPFSIKLIDTIDGRLIDADTSFRYAALSYVWGGHKQAELENDTFDLFHRSGSITDSSPHLSGTIKDTITVCRALNERYVWIDCLCIKQDDSVNKMAQIERMDDIYGHAAFTIVNAGHQHRLSADSPLSGVRPDTRKIFQFAARADSFSVIASACPRLQEDLDLSKWRSRAWTFQEEHLSRALLIFTSSQCFFQAGKRLFCEDMIFEADQEGIDLIPLRFSTLQSYHCKADVDFTSEFDLEAYCFIIESYVKRDLTFDEDAIKAVLGMLRRFSVKLDGRDSRLIFGHPSAAFDYSLCWTSDCFYPNTRRSSFPSWSWAARKQHIKFDLGHRFNKQHTLTSRGPLATSLYTDALGDGRFTLNKLLVEQTGVDILPVKKSDTEIQLYYTSHNLGTKTLAERELHFSTTFIKLRVSRFCVATGERLDTGRTEHASGWGRFIVYSDQLNPADASSTTPKEIGEISLESRWRDTQPEELYLDFIVIRANPGWEPFCTFQDRKEDKATDTALDSDDPNPSADRQSAGDEQIDEASTEPDQQQTSSDPESRELFPALEDPRLDVHTQECTIYSNQSVDRRVRAAENWRLSLMCIEWINVPSGEVRKGKGKQEKATRTVASRLDVMRFGPSVREWLDLGPTHVDVVLV